MPSAWREAAGSVLMVVGALMVGAIGVTVVVAVVVVAVIAVRGQVPYGRWHGAAVTTAVIGGALAVSVLVPVGLGLDTQEQHSVWFTLLVLGTWLGAQSASESGARTVRCRSQFGVYRRAEMAPPREAVELASADGERRALRRSATRAALLVGTLAVVGLWWAGTPWLRAISASVVLGIVVSLACVLAFNSARLDEICPACGAPLTSVGVDDPWIPNRVEVRCLECEPLTTRRDGPPTEPAPSFAESRDAPVAAPVSDPTTEGMIVCPDCGRQNRVAGGRSKAAAVCGVCKAWLFP